MAPARRRPCRPTLRHPKEAASDVAFALAAVGRAWEAGVELDPATLFADEERHRVPLPTYPFDHQRYWVEPDAADAPRAIGEGRAAQAPARRRVVLDAVVAALDRRRRSPSGRCRPPVVIIGDGHPLAAALAARLGASRRVVSVGLGERFLRQPGGRFEVNPARADDWVALVDALAADGALPGTIVHVTAVGPSRGRRRLGLGGRRRARRLPRDGRARPRQRAVPRPRPVGASPSRCGWRSSRAASTPSTRPIRCCPERALLHGAVRVIPRELGHVDTLAIDVDLPKAGIAGRRAPGRRHRGRARRRVGRPTSSCCAAASAGCARSSRWRCRRPLDSPWQPRGVHLITGGFGGIGLSIAQHIAKSSDSPTLVLVGRSALPPEVEWDAAAARRSTPIRAMRQRIEAVAAAADARRRRRRRRRPTSPTRRR